MSTSQSINHFATSSRRKLTRGSKSGCIYVMWCRDFQGCGFSCWLVKIPRTPGKRDYLPGASGGKPFATIEEAVAWRDFVLAREGIEL